MTKKEAPKPIEDSMLPGESRRAGLLPRPAPNSVPVQDPSAPAGGFISPTRKKKVARGAAPALNVEGVLGELMKPLMAAQQEAARKKLENAWAAGKDEGIRIGMDTRERIKRDEEKKKEIAPSLTFFSARDRAKFDRAEKLKAQGLSPAQIAKKLDGMIFGAPTNVPGSVEGLPKDFLESRNLTLTPEAGMPAVKTAKGLTPEEEWKRMFPENLVVRPAAPVAPARPGNQGVANVVGPDWLAQADDTPQSITARRATLVRALANDPTGGYGLVGEGPGEITPKVPGVVAPAGAVGFVNKYGSGFATNGTAGGSMALPKATPPQPAAAQPELVMPGIIPKIDYVGTPLPAAAYSPIQDTD